MTGNLNYIGYHGTSKANASKIERSNFFIDYTKPGWLGSGVYFFHEDPEMASYWSRRKFGGNSVLFRVEISIPEQLVFDVTDPLGDNNKYYQAIRKRFFEEELRKYGVNIKSKSRDDLDSKVYNMICKRDGYKLVRGVTITPDDNDRAYNLAPHTPNGVELCLKDLRYLVSKERFTLERAD